ncbi:MAG TPA: TlpA disulfide reductase family protein [Blastocatellia bacterium]|nr:TlpA disulfide reductase family protein [Blastocatellia bacterium]
MLQSGDPAPQFSLLHLDGHVWRYSSSSSNKPTLLVFIETDCPTCRLTLPYLNRLAESLGDGAANVIAISQDALEPTRELVAGLDISFPVVIDHDLGISRLFDPLIVPTLFLLDIEGRIAQTETGFDKAAINSIGARMAEAAGLDPITIAPEFDGAPAVKPGCSSRHLEPGSNGRPAVAVNLSLKRGKRASRIKLDQNVDPCEYSIDTFRDPLPVVPPTIERVERMLAVTTAPPGEIIALIPPNYGAATVEKIAANAVMAGCPPEMMRVLVPLVRAVADERFNIHGVQATTHFAAPLIIINGPLRRELGFASGSNVFSNAARANSSLGRALQLILANLGGARSGEIDMSTLGNPGKFAFCIAENEEESPWEPLHVELGFAATQSTLTLFAGEPPKGVSEHNARDARQVLKAICYSLATSWSYRMCGMAEAIVVLCPEHVKTIHGNGFTKQETRQFLFENTGVPLRAYTDAEGAEGTQYSGSYQQIIVDGEPCYQKFRAPDAIKLLVAGGTAGKFSAVVSSWLTGSRGSQMVTYPVD